jgi:hypothetical protein
MSFIGSITAPLEKHAQIRLEKQIKDGKGENADLDRLRYNRLGVEIDLEALMEGDLQISRARAPSDSIK